MAKSAVDGNHLLYHFLQKELQRSDYWLFQMVVARLVASLGIWLSPDTYRALPILLPFAVRDSDARGNRRLGVPDQWGSPNSEGYFRDDNSLIKGLPRSLRIDSPSALYNGRSMGNGFVASHVWRELIPNSHGAGLASRHPLTYSFVPNLVWLPSQVAKLTDREGSFAQQYLQAISVSLYRHISIDGPLRRCVDDAWDLLPEPLIPGLGVPTLERLSFFHHDEGFVDRRRRTISTVLAALDMAARGDPTQSKVVSSRYSEGLSSLPPGGGWRLATYLRNYIAAIDGGG
jgi:hypothetical protein